jgi:hypothetical protein
MKQKTIVRVVAVAGIAAILFGVIVPALTGM